MVKMVKLKFFQEIKHKNTHFHYDHGRNTKFSVAKIVKLWFDYEIWAQNDHFDH